MAYTVRKLLESEQFPKMKLLCGKKGLDREVKGIRIIEIEDMEQYLTGGEMLITSFQVYLSCSDREVEQHFEDLVKSDISGFIVKKEKRMIQQESDGSYWKNTVKNMRFHCLRFRKIYITGELFAML